MKHTAWVINLHMDALRVDQHWDCLHLWHAMDEVEMGRYQSDRWPWPGTPDCVVIAGGAHSGAEDVARIAQMVAALPACPIWLVSDEASLFPWRSLPEPTRWYISTPRMSKHEPLIGSARFFGEGAGPPVALPPVDKDLDVAFMGQVTTNRRHELVEVLRGMNSDRVLLEATGGFMQGRPHAGYMAQMFRAKIAPAPSGACTADSFRCWQAIEAGCVPIVERLTPDGEDHGFWEMTYPDAPFPVVDSWTEAPAVIDGLLCDDDWSGLSVECQAWWVQQQERMVGWLREDLALAR